MGFINVPPGQEDTKRRSSRKDISKRYREIFRVLCVCVMDLLSINSHHSLSHLLNCVLSPAAGSRERHLVVVLLLLGSYFALSCFYYYCLYSGEEEEYKKKHSRRKPLTFISAPTSPVSVHGITIYTAR